MTDENKSIEIEDEIGKEQITSNDEIENVEIKEEENISDLISSGKLIRAEDLSKIIDSEIKKRQDALQKKGARKEDVHLIGAYKEQTLLTDEEFIIRLIKWNVRIEMAKVLADHHSKLSQRKLWEYLRENYKPRKKR